MWDFFIFPTSFASILKFDSLTVNVTLELRRCAGLGRHELDAGETCGERRRPRPRARRRARDRVDSFFICSAPCRLEVEVTAVIRPKERFWFE